jgi:hypothetical protein
MEYFWRCDVKDASESPRSREHNLAEQSVSYTTNVLFAYSLLAVESRQLTIDGPNEERPSDLDEKRSKVRSSFAGKGPE